MAKSKKSNAKKADSNQAEARPVGEGKDPLAEGNTLVNPTNSEAETHYDVKEKSEDVAAQDAQNKIDGQDANERAEQHNAQSADASANAVPNESPADQDEAADDSDREGR